MNKSNCIFFSLIVLCLFSCKKSKDDLFITYIEKKCSFNNKDTCYINLKDVFNVDYDTMFVFDEYTQLQGVRLILGLEEYDNKNSLLPNGFLVEDSHKKIILIKNRNIVYEDDIQSHYFYDDGTIITKTGTFDKDSFVHYARMYISPRFLVTKKNDHKGHIKKYFYILENVGADGCIVKSDTINK